MKTFLLVAELIAVYTIIGLLAYFYLYKAAEPPLIEKPNKNTENAVESQVRDAANIMGKILFAGFVIGIAFQLYLKFKRKKGQKDDLDKEKASSMGSKIKRAKDFFSQTGSKLSEQIIKASDRLNQIKDNYRNKSKMKDENLELLGHLNTKH